MIVVDFVFLNLVFFLDPARGASFDALSATGRDQHRRGRCKAEHNAQDKPRHARER